MLERINVAERNNLYLALCQSIETVICTCKIRLIYLPITSQQKQKIPTAVKQHEIKFRHLQNLLKMKRVVLNLLLCRAALRRRFELLQLSEASLLTHPKLSLKVRPVKPNFINFITLLYSCYMLLPTLQFVQFF